MTAVAKGATLGPYEILSPLGAGGMGEVWRARDRRIGRDVAVKVLPEVFDARDERLQRFEQEARTAGSLNHPGLVTIFDVGATNGSPYIVMELLEGQTLRDAIGDPAPVAMPVRKVIDYAIQLASALATAHEKGIIHRDLKPENIFITPDRRVKILDFGLAKLAPDATDGDGRRTSRHVTSSGIAVGTPGYMSPEQVRAASIDHRTDIFSLGSVIYEMLSGRPAFERFSAVETMHAVLTDEPQPLSELGVAVSPFLEAIVRHCLDKDPRERFQSARDLAFHLQNLPEHQQTATGNRVPPSQRPRLSRTGIAVALAVLAAGGGFAVARLQNRKPNPVTRTYKQLTFAAGVEQYPALAPDGKSFAYVSSQTGNDDIYVQRVDGRTAVNVTIESSADDTQPAFSPDGSQIAFRSERDGGGIFVMGVTGESVRRLTGMGYNPSWSPDGTRIVFSTESVDSRPHVRQNDGRLWIVDTRSTILRPLIQYGVGGPDFGRHSDAVQPNWSPHGKRIAFWGVSDFPGQRDIYTVDPAAPQPKQTVVRVTSDPALHWNPVWSPDGRYLYFGSDRDGTLNLWRVAIDETSGKPLGAPEPVSLPASLSANFTMSRQREMAFRTVTRAHRLIAFPFDPDTGQLAEPRVLFGGSEEILTFDPSPDGKTIAFTTGGAQEDLFIANIDGTRVRQLTNDAARDRGVAWASDGKTLYFYSNRDGSYHIWKLQADGSGLTRVTSDEDVKRIGARNLYVPHVSPDGRTLAAQSDRGAVFVHLSRPMGHRLEAFGGRSSAAPKWSRDGKRILLEMAGSSDIAIYSRETRKLDTIADSYETAHWLPDGQRLAVFDRQNVRIVNLGSRRVVTSPLKAPPGAVWEVAAARLSRDGSTLYARQTLEQGDVWLVRLE